MDKFYVFRAPPPRRARLHLGSCLYCRNGKGVKDQDKGRASFTSWEGPFATLTEAEARMATYNFDDVGRCGYCLPSTAE
jgi:hypothetical protein